MRRLEFFSSIFLLIFSLLVCREAYKLSLGPRLRQVEKKLAKEVDSIKEMLIIQSV
jgi:hypothetical protein